MSKNLRYLALLRGINVGGHHKLPMADLKKEMAALGFAKVETLLNSGNVIFEAAETKEAELEKRISNHLENTFGFPVPVLIRKAEDVINLLEHNPFKHIEITKELRLYISFLPKQPDIELDLPVISGDKSFQIIEIQDRAVCSVLDLSFTRTTKGMEVLEQLFGKQITTRNWNTIEKIAVKLTSM